MRRGVGLLLALIVLASPALAASLGTRSSGVLAAETSQGYRIVYRVEDRSRPQVRVTTEVVEVGRPYDGRLETRSGRPPGGEITSGQVTNRDYFWQLGEQGVPHFGVRRIPAGPARDVSYGALLDAVRGGVVDALGAGRIAGRRCTWFASGEPGPQRLEPATAEGRIESCVDRSGMLLSEVWVFGGKAARIVEAVSVSTRVPSPRRFLNGKDLRSETLQRPDALRLIQGQFVVDEDADVDLPTAIRAPRGWRRDRRAIASTASGGGRATQFLSETFVSDGQLVVVERGTHPALRPGWPVDEGGRIDLGTLGAGRVVYYADRVELRLIGNLGFVRVAAPSQRLAVEFARGLRAIRADRRTTPARAALRGR